MKKVLSVFGTRPEAIKMAPLIKALQNNPLLDSKVCVTGQHREMLDMVLKVFSITPDYDFNLMKHRQTLTNLTCGVITDLESILVNLQPNLVLVHGDTTTTMAAALAAFYQQIPVGHVEAGLRSHNIYSPYPEEMNRKLVSSIATFHFAPTESNKQNLLREGIPSEKIYVTGNTVIDALLDVTSQDYLFSDPELRKVDFSRPTILLTSHRRENWGSPMVETFMAVRDIALLKKGINIIFPVHLNPDIGKLAFEYLGDINNVWLIEPLDYLPFAHLMKKSTLILTDSGGIQEEGPALGKPVLVLREETERPEAVNAGTVKVIGTSRQRIVEETIRLLEDKDEYNRMATAVNPYGDGTATASIVKIIGDNI